MCGIDVHAHEYKKKEKAKNEEQKQERAAPDIFFLKSETVKIQRAPFCFLSGWH